MAILVAPPLTEQADSLPLRAAMALDVATVEEMARLHGDNPIGQAAGAWLGTYNACMLMGLGEVTARRRAAFVWDAASADDAESTALAQPERDTCVTPAGHAWLMAYQVARGFGFAESVAQRQAFAAAERADS